MSEVNQKIFNCIKFWSRTLNFVETVLHNWGHAILHTGVLKPNLLPTRSPEHYLSKMHQDLTRSLGQKPQALGGPKGFLFLVTSVIANPTSLLHFCKVWVFWEGHKIWKNLRHTFDKSVVFYACNSVLAKNSTKIFKNKCGHVVLYKLYENFSKFLKIDKENLVK